MNSFGLVAPNRDKHLAKGGIERERLEELVAEGKSLAEMAGELGVGKTTVRHWLGRYGLKTSGSRGRKRRQPAAAARDAGKLITTLDCQRHGSTEFVLEGRSYYRCKRCRSEAVSEHRRRVKSTLVEEAGGCCALCGYSRSARALAHRSAARSSSGGRTVARAGARSRSPTRRPSWRCAAATASRSTGSRVTRPT